MMAIALRHPTTAKVDNWASFLRTLLNEYPRFLNDRDIKSEKEFQQIAHDNSDGDRDVESTIYSFLCTAFNDDADKKNLFYQAIFIMCYSYYESCIALLSKEANAKETINAICRSKKISLSEESLKAIEYLQSDINDLRNNLCHNNFGTYRKTNVLRKLAERNFGLSYEDNIISFTDTTLITDTLDKIPQFGITYRFFFGKSKAHIPILHH